MHRIDGPSATVDNKFTEGSPTGGVPATVVDADWLNDIQENIVTVILNAGLSLTKGRALDLFDAIVALNVSGGSLAGNGWTQFGNGLIFQWAAGSTTNGSGVWTYPIPFPNNCFRVFASQDAQGTYFGVGANPELGNEKIRASLRSEVAPGSDAMFLFAIGN